MGWSSFSIVFMSSSILWIIGGVTSLLKIKKQKTFVILFTATGILLLLLFIIDLWISLARPPFRTLGETRLWYSFFLPVVGLLLYLRWNNLLWASVYSSLMAIVFLVVNYLSPETHDQTLMPALQSIWFIPHVLVYILSYAVLAGSAIVAVKGLINYYVNNKPIQYTEQANLLVYIGFSFLTLGLVFGAFWAKSAWGHYWTWDPKETWALLTWLFYLIYIHYQHHKPRSVITHSWILGVSFIILLICWFGVNYLSAAQNSVHTY